MEPDSIKAQEARREAMKPDIQKLRDYALALDAVPIPQVSNEAVAKELRLLVHRVEQACEAADLWCDEQEVWA